MKTVYVAMSGGVDSSVAAALLKQQGFGVTGVFFKPWSPSTSSGQSLAYCDWQQDRLDAMRVAAKLGIPFQTWDFSKEYGKQVAQYMIDGYRAGITPNPDVMCNKEIKFGLFLQRALKEGADFIATGHYARRSGLRLLKGIDKNKDQSYFLWTLTQQQLKHCLFPIGEYVKSDVRKLAKKFGLPTHAKKDSQGVCFVGELNMHDFLAEYIKPQPGNILLGDTPIGTHDGAAYYTIGQRHGLNITSGGGPYYVVRKNLKKNILYVSKFRMTNDEFLINDLNWVRKIKVPLKCTVQLRYRSEPTSASLVIRNSNFVIKTDKKLPQAADGQSLVIYRGPEVLGGGILHSFGEAGPTPSVPEL